MLFIGARQLSINKLSWNQTIPTVRMDDRTKLELNISNQKNDKCIKLELDSSNKMILIEPKDKKISYGEMIYVYKLGSFAEIQ